MKQKLLYSFKLKATLLVALLCAVCTGAWAADPTVTLTQTALGLTGSYTTGTEKVVDGITFVYTDLMKNNDNIQAKASSGVIYNKTAFPGNIKSVAITHSSTARATTISGSSDGTNWTQISTGSGSITADFTSYSYKYFKITRGSNAAYWTQIVITYEAASGPTTYTVTYDANGGTGTLTDEDSPYNSGATVTVLGNTFTRTGFDFSGWNTAANGTGTGYAAGATFTITGNTTLYAQWTASSLSSISVNTSGATTKFRQGEAFTSAGVVVTATYENGSSQPVTATFSTPDMSQTGEQTITVTYEEGGVEKTTTYTINVYALTSITLSGTYPTTFNQGATFSSEGIVVTGHYDDDGDELAKDVTADAEFSGYNLSTPGEKTVTVSYGGKSATYTITVNEYVQPTNFDINLNDTFFGTNYGGSASGITDANPVSGSLNNVIVTYAGSGNHYINGSQIRFYPSNKLTFTAPSGYYITQIVFTADGTWAATISADNGTYTSGTKTWTGEASSVLFTGSGSSRCDMSKVTITLAKQKALSSIALSGSYPTVFEVGDEFSHEGAVVTATYDDASTQVVTATFSTPDLSEAGTKTVTVTYTEKGVTKTTTYEITVKAPAALTSIVLGGTYSTTFNVGDEFTHEGMTVTAYFDDETNADVTTQATFSGYDMSTAGTQTVTVSYTKGETTKTVTYTITVNTVSVSGVTLNKTSATIYTTSTLQLEASFTPSNATNKNVSWESDNDAVATVDESGLVTAVSVGTAHITVTTEDGSKTSTCDVTVKAVPIVVATLDFTDPGWGFPADYDKAEKSYTNNGLTITVGESSNGHKKITSGTTQKTLIFGKEGATITLPAFPFNVNKIKVYGDSGASGAVTFNIFVGDDAVSTEVTSSKETHDFAIAADKQAAGTVYVIKVTNANNCQISKIEVLANDFPVTIGVAGYTTFSAPVATDFSETALEVYTAAVNAGKTAVELTEVASKKVPANTGVILKGTSTSGKVIATADALSGNLLQASDGSVTGDGSTIYALGVGKKGKNAGEVGFFLVGDGVTIPANKAYLTVTSGGVGVKEFLGFDFDGQTAISEIANGKSLNGQWFNLAGQRVNKAQRSAQGDASYLKKGIFIVNGKKVVK